MYKIRFHLARGKHYQHWQVVHPNGEKSYYDPEIATLIMKHCLLHNQKGAALKIFNGENKRPCAWVKCKKVEIIPKNLSATSSTEVAYNPRLSPHWVMILQGQLVKGDYDKKYFEQLATYSKQIYSQFNT